MTRSSFALVLLTLGTAPTKAADDPDWPNHPENTWVKQSPTKDHPAPPFGWEGGGSYDPLSRKWIHHAGHDGIPQGFVLFTYDLHSRKWEQKFPPTSPPGVCCVDGSFVFDVANKRFVRFPGGMLGHGYQWSRGEKLKDSAVWLYDPARNEWTNMRPAPYGKPLAREGIGGLDAGATYDAANELVVSFGGQGSAGGTCNLFFYDAYANRLYRIEEKGAPSPRDGMGICCDTKNECLVVFGSQYASDEKTHIFHLRTGKWESLDLNPRPPGKKGKTYSTIPKMAYDSANGICLCVVWDDATGKHQTWTLDVPRQLWTQMKPPEEPTPSMSRSRNLSYSAEHNVFILELAPQATKGKGAEIWTYRYKKTAPDKRPAAPLDLTATTERDRVMLAWHPGGPGAKEYQVWRAEAVEPWKLNFIRVGKTDKTSFGDRELLEGREYFYTVRAIGADGAEGPMSHRARSVPRVPLTPVVSVLTAWKIDVAWDASPAKDVIGYNVYRGLVSVRTVKKGEPKPWRDNDPEYAAPVTVEVSAITDIKKLNDKLIAGTTFLDESVDLTKPGDESFGYKFAVYAYIVKAVNRRGGESGPSPYALTIPSEPRDVLCREVKTAAQLSWSANPEKGIIGYHVYKLEGTWNIKRLTEEPLKLKEFQQTDVGQTRYWVVAVDVLGQEGQPSSPAWHRHKYEGFFTGEWHQ